MQETGRCIECLGHGFKSARLCTQCRGSGVVFLDRVCRCGRYARDMYLGALCCGSLYCKNYLEHSIGNRANVTFGSDYSVINPPTMGPKIPRRVMTEAEVKEQESIWRHKYGPSVCDRNHAQTQADYEALWSGMLF
jgi:hypothetical protein